MVTIFSKIELYKPVTADETDFLGGGLVPFLIASSVCSLYFFRVVTTSLNLMYKHHKIPETMAIHYRWNHFVDYDICSRQRLQD